MSLLVKQNYESKVAGDLKCHELHPHFHEIWPTLLFYWWRNSIHTDMPTAPLSPYKTRNVCVCGRKKETVLGLNVL